MAQATFFIASCAQLGTYGFSVRIRCAGFRARLSVRLHCLREAAMDTHDRVTLER